ncbi:ABC transporter permease subunit [Alteromonas flava]|uniref:ABC transporter permease subunit n=1 Tax=Alteromonas flava TaxID=2048003 RepID=UPI000C28F891|nr:ABC transporter permease subunit [Alteromonas flava]
MQHATPSRQRYRDRIDYFAQRVVVFFGWAVLLTLGILIWHLLSQALPLFQSPKIAPVGELNMPPHKSVEYIGDLEQGGLLITTSNDCALHFYILSVSNQFKLVKNSPHSCSSLVQVLGQGENIYVVEVSNQQLMRVQQVVSAGSDLTIKPILSRAIPNEYLGASIVKVEVTDSWVIVRLSNGQQSPLLWIERENPSIVVQQNYSADDWYVALPSASASAFVGGDGVNLWPLGATKPTVARLGDSSSGFLLATDDPRSVYLSTQAGSVSKWTLFNRDGEFVLAQLYSIGLGSDENPLSVHIDPSVNLGLILTDKARTLLFNRVSGEVLHRYQFVEQPTALAWFGNNLYMQADQRVTQWQVKNRDSTTTFSTLFEPQLYAGYHAPDYVWQTTNATDYQLSKYNIIPLIIGSLKASLVALMIAIPLALGAAIYSAFFVHPSLRTKIKPAIEMLEAIPSVVIGFIAAVWLAPLAEQFLVSICFFIVLMPLVLIGVTSIHAWLAGSLPEQLRKYWELPAVSLLVIGIAMLCLFFAFDVFRSLSSSFEFMQGNLNISAQISKTTLVVAIALGLAISPTIYSLAEDAIEGVPDSLKRASFALGATRLQTLRNVVLKVAFPGILAALMLGFGRAFGETMIVLMVTGNTPIADWDLLAGLRAMTANLAIELPEAEVGNAHYRVLFLTACLLFLFTFVINTFAELLRMRARRRSAR